MPEENVEKFCELNLDFQRNALITKIGGYFSATEIDAICNELISKVKQLKPGFYVVTDMTSFKAASREGVERISDMQKTLHTLGMSKAIRILGFRISALQMRRISKEANLRSAVEVKTLEEAFSVIEESQHQDQ